jgi:hypothetical protein
LKGRTDPEPSTPAEEVPVEYRLDRIVNRFNATYDTRGKGTVEFITRVYFTYWS